jgi:hypothetical protein
LFVILSVAKNLGLKTNRLDSQYGMLRCAQHDKAVGVSSDAKNLDPEDETCRNAKLNASLRSA